MRNHVKRYFTALSLMAFLALPVWAHTDSATLTVTNPTIIAGKNLKPGTYKLEVQPNQTQLKVVNTQSDRTVAEVPCQWVSLKNSPTNTEVLLNKNKVTEIEFSGHMQAVKVS
jgi:hypothetical protein